MKIIKSILLLSLILLITSCLNVNGVIDYSPEIQFFKNKRNSNVTFDNFAKISPNMPYSNVVEILGEGVLKGKSVGVQREDEFHIYYWQNNRSIISISFIALKDTVTGTFDRTVYTTTQTLLK